MRQRDHVLQTAKQEVMNLLAILGASPEDRIQKFIINVSGNNVFTFSITRKIFSDGGLQGQEKTSWECHDIDLAKQLVDLLGFIEGEKITNITIQFDPVGIPSVTITKLADDRLLDLDWSLLAKKGTLEWQFVK